MNENWKRLTLDIIISLIKSLKESNKYDNWKDDPTSLWGSKYLLNQTIRQYKIPIENYYISVEAKNLWNTIRDDDIHEFSLDSCVEIENDCKVDLYKFKGAEKTPVKVEGEKGSKFIFKTVFHNEHIIPISLFIEALLKLNDLSHSNVESILKKICICKILKTEDRKLGRTSGRKFNLENNIKNIYNVNDVFLEKLK